MAGLLLRVGELDEGAQYLLDDPGPLVFMVCKDLDETDQQ